MKRGFNILKRTVRTLITVFMLCLMALHNCPAVKAAGNTETYANLVIFVKMNGDPADAFNAGTNWRQIRDMYDNAPNSFSNYISAISEGKAKVMNYFPQEYTDANGIAGVKTYEMSQASYITDAEMLTEIIRAINMGTIPVDTSAVKLDYQDSGILDNLTIIVQGGTVNGDAHAYHAEYNDSASLLGSNPALLVSRYNAIPSAYLVNEDSTQINLNQQQGVISHEFLHTMGFTDLYPYAGSGRPVWMWDIMAANTASPQYPLSYSRAQRGWITSEEITESGDYTLTAVTETGGTRLFTVKTPLPEGDSETICLEYRIKDYQAEAFERHIPGTGLLMYRVDDKVDGKANSAGANYLYVYRPGDSDEKIGSAALGSDAAITSFGSTDLNNGNKTDNILYYSDGQNSGVRISNISMNGKQLTFHIEFPDYSQSVWDSLGTHLDSDVSTDAYLYTDPCTGQLYAAYAKGGGSSSQVVVKAWNETGAGGSWEQVGSPVGAGNSGPNPTVAVCNGELYLSYSTGASSTPVVAKLINGQWNNVFTGSTAYAMDQQLAVDGSEIYMAYTGNAQQLYIYDVKTGGLIAVKSGQHIARPAVVKWGSKFYVAYSDWFSNDERAVIESYDTAAAVWKAEHTYSMNRSNSHGLQIYNNKLYAYLGTGTTNPVISVYDGNSWMDQTVPGMTNYTMSSMLVINDAVYLAYGDTDDSRGKMIKQEGSTFTSLNDNLGLNLAGLSVCSYGGTIFVGTQSQGTTTLVVRRKVVSAGGGAGTGGSPTAPPETPPVTPGSDVLELTPPAGYNNNIIYVDGVEHAAERSGDTFSVRLDNTSAQTAVMYSYNENNIPVGMYVWRLSYQNGYFTATPLPGLENLISYHGFSIRVTSPAGIRFKSGIDAGVKQQLINNNVDGYKLVEYGTLFITDANREKYPFVKDGTKVGGGRAYWMENGQINDKVFETVGGRNRFASVLINLSEKQYATNIAFRGYIILENSEGTITLYGPPVSRSIYSVAKQVLKRGEFPAGSSGYNYVSGIVNKVEGK